MYDLLYLLIGGYGTTVTAPSSASQEILVHTEIDAGGAAEALRNADKIVIVPGYGLAVAQAATVVADIALSLRKEGKEVCHNNDDDDDRNVDYVDNRDDDVINNNFDYDNHDDGVEHGHINGS